MSTASRTATPRRRASPAKRNADADAVAITHSERVVFAKPRTTKQQVADYYRAVMPWFLPGVQARPLSVIRCPDGVDAACFFQKHVTPGMKRVGAVPIREESGKRARYLYAEDAASVMELVQFGSIEFHPWGSHVDDVERADRVIFDLDPAPDVPWARVVAAAKRVRARLAKQRLVSFVRTTGGKGLHVVVPLSPPASWTSVKAFAREFAVALADEHPDEFVATASKQLRRGRIYIDWLRNARGATSVASYSLRARKGAPVAMPLAWQALGRLRGAHEFDIASTPRLLARRRRDPWDGHDRLRQSIGHRNENDPNDKRRDTR